jgi:hypothetical protein
MAPPSAKLARSYGCVCVCVSPTIKGPNYPGESQVNLTLQEAPSGQEPLGASKPYIPNHNQSIIS